MIETTSKLAALVGQGTTTFQVSEATTSTSQQEAWTRFADVSSSRQETPEHNEKEERGYFFCNTRIE